MSKRITPLIKHNAKTENIKRPNHPDFMDSSELKKIKFTGVRPNQMALQWEFWILGNVEKTVSFVNVKNDKFALTRAHVELFHMTPDPNLFKKKPGER